MAETPSLIHLLSSNKFSGVERYSLDICRYFYGKGWDVAVYTCDARIVDSQFENHCIPIRHAPLQGLLDFDSVRILSADLKHSTRNTVIHAHRFRDAVTAIVARRLSGRKDIRIIVTRHKVRRGIDSWFYRHVYKQIDAIIFVSNAALDRFLSSWRGKKLPFINGKIHMLHNSLNLPLQPPVDEPDKGPIVAMFLGSVKPGKGLETLIDALPALKGARTRMRIIGAGHPDYLDKLRQRAEARGVMQMIDWKKHTSDPHSIIKEAHFGVFPSTDREAFGMPNIEFMYNGRPQVSTNTGGQTEYLTDGVDAIIVPPGSSQDLGNALLKLATDREFRIKLGKNAYDKFKDDLSWQKFAVSLQRIYTGES